MSHSPSVQISKALLFHTLTHYPKLFPSINAEIIQKAPTWVDTNPRQFTCVCGCYHPSTLACCEGDLISVKASPKLHSVRRFFLVDGWLVTDVWIVQCDRCGQIYWS